MCRTGGTRWSPPSSVPPKMTTPIQSTDVLMAGILTTRPIKHSLCSAGFCFVLFFFLPSCRAPLLVVFSALACNLLMNVICVTIMQLQRRGSALFIVVVRQLYLLSVNVIAVLSLPLSARRGNTPVTWLLLVNISNGVAFTPLSPPFFLTFSPSSFPSFLP